MPQVLQRRTGRSVQFHYPCAITMSRQAPSSRPRPPSGYYECDWAKEDDDDDEDYVAPTIAPPSSPTDAEYAREQGNAEADSPSPAPAAKRAPPQ